MAKLVKLGAHWIDPDYIVAVSVQKDEDGNSEVKVQMAPDIHLGAGHLETHKAEAGADTIQKLIDAGLIDN